MAHKRVVFCLLGTILAASMLSGCAGKKSDPVTITVWTYYNGDQLDTFNNLTEKFNETVGKKQGITVDSKSLGTVEDLEKKCSGSSRRRGWSFRSSEYFFCIC